MPPCQGQTARPEREQPGAGPTFAPEVTVAAGSAGADPQSVRATEFELFERHLNAAAGPRPAGARASTADYVRGEGPYLFDDDGRPLPRPAAGFGVFAFGRNHPAIVAALDQVLDGQLAEPGADGRVAARRPPGRAAARAPARAGSTRCSSATRAPRRSRRRSSSPAPRPAAPGSCTASTPSTA